MSAKTPRRSKENERPSANIVVIGGSQCAVEVLMSLVGAPPMAEADTENARITRKLIFGED